jgi:hypothetical protein
MNISIEFKKELERVTTLFFLNEKSFINNFCPTAECLSDINISSDIVRFSYVVNASYHLSEMITFQDFEDWLEKI